MLNKIGFIRRRRERFCSEWNDHREARPNMVQFWPPHLLGFRLLIWLAVGLFEIVLGVRGRGVQDVRLDGFQEGMYFVWTIWGIMMALELLWLSSSGPERCHICIENEEEDIEKTLA